MKPKAAAISVPSFCRSLTVKLIQVKVEFCTVARNSEGLVPWILDGLVPGVRVTPTALDFLASTLSSFGGEVGPTIVLEMDPLTPFIA